MLEIKKEIFINEKNYKDEFKKISNKSIELNFLIIKVGVFSDDKKIEEVLSEWNEIGTYDGNYNGNYLKIESLLHINKNLDLYKNIVFDNKIFYNGEHLYCKNCHFNDTLIVSNKIKKIELCKTTINGNIGTTEHPHKEVKHLLYLKNLEEIKLINSTIKKEFIISNCSLDNININSSNLTHFCVNDCNTECKNKKISIKINNSESGNIDNFIVRTPGKINKFKFYGNKENETNFEFSNALIEDGINFFVCDLDITKLEIKNATFLSSVAKFNNIKISKNFVLKDVDFGPIVFNEFIIDNKSKNFFKSAVFTNATFNNICWGNVNLKGEKKMWYSGKDNVSFNMSNIELKDMYRQLKNVMDNNGNKTEANKFYAKEMHYYGKSLEIIPNMKKSEKIKKLSEQTEKLYNKIEPGIQKVGDITRKIEFLFKKIACDFGNSWLRPLIFLLITTAIYSSFSHNVPNSSDWLKEFSYNLFPLSGLFPEPDKATNIETGLLILTIGYKIFYGIFLYFIGVGLRRETTR